MAVTVEGLPSVVLDDEYRIVEVSESALASFGPLLGRSVPEAFPGSQALFLPTTSAPGGRASASSSRSTTAATSSACGQCRRETASS